MEDVIQILKDTRALLSDPAHWTRRHSARNAAGKRTLSTSADAVRFCLLGGFEHSIWRRWTPSEVTQWQKNSDLYDEVVKAFAPVIPSTQEIADFNDARSRKHPQILRALDKAIELAEEKLAEKRSALARSKAEQSSEETTVRELEFA